MAAPRNCQMFGCRAFVSTSTCRRARPAHHQSARRAEGIFRDLREYSGNLLGIFRRMQSPSARPQPVRGTRTLHTELAPGNP
eukprot:1082626-Prorocentrum_minimum.AAC.1